MSSEPCKIPLYFVKNIYKVVLFSKTIRDITFVSRKLKNIVERKGKGNVNIGVLIFRDKKKYYFMYIHTIQIIKNIMSSYSLNICEEDMCIPIENKQIYFTRIKDDNNHYSVKYFYQNGGDLQEFNNNSSTNRECIKFNNSTGEITDDSNNVVCKIQDILDTTVNPYKTINHNISSFTKLSSESDTDPVQQPSQRLSVIQNRLVRTPVNPSQESQESPLAPLRPRRPAPPRPPVTMKDMNECGEANLSSDKVEQCKHFCKRVIDEKKMTEIGANIPIEFTNFCSRLKPS